MPSTAGTDAPASTVTRRAPSLAVVLASTGAFALACLAAAAGVWGGADGDFGRPERVGAIAAFTCLIGLAALVAAVSGQTMRARLAVGLTLSVVLAAIGMPWIADHISFLPSVDQSVGSAVYRGLSYRQNYVALATAMIVALAISVGLSRGSARDRRRRQRRAPVEDTSPVARDARWQRWMLWASTAAVGLGALTMLPDFDAIARVAQTGTFPYSWDTDNLVSWQAFVSNGFRPMVDFFYPYGLQHIFTSTLLEGPLLQFVLQLGLLALLGRAVWLLAGRRPWPPLAVVGTVVLLGSPVVAEKVLAIAPFSLGVGSIVVGDVWRYLIPVVVALLFATLDLRARRIGLNVALFGIAAVVAMYLELPLFGYAMLGVLAVVLLDLAVDTPRTRADALKWLRGLGIAAVIPIVGLVSWFIVEHVSGRWLATTDWVFSPTPISNATAAPTRIDGSLSKVFSADFVLLVAPVAGVVTAIVLGVSRRFELRAPARYAAAVGAVTTAILVKDLVRPAAGAWLFLPVLLVMGTLALVPLGREVWDAPIRAFVAGLVVAIAIVGGSLHDSATALRELPGRIRRDAAVIVNGRDDIAHAEKARFAPERFEGHPERELVDALKPTLAPGERVYVLGDAQVIYVLLQQKPYFEITAYDSSPISEQRRVVDSLRRDPPALVVWSPANRAFDLVPQIVRTPLVYGWIIEHYRPETTVAGYKVLVPRRANEAVPWAFWRRTLGHVVDLGAVTAAADLPEAGPCTTCVDYLVVDLGSAPTRKISRDFDVHIDSQTYTIRLRLLPRHEQYVVRLDRVWFWRLARSAHIEPRLTGAPHGTTTHLVQRPETGALY